MGIALQVFLALALELPVTALEGWDAVATARLTVRVKAMRDAGDPTTLAELAARYPDPPEGRNAAVHYNAAFEAMDAHGDLGPARERLLPIVGNAKLPEPNEELAPAMLAAIRAYVDENAEALKQLHQAAALEHCKFDLNFEDGIGMLLPHLSKLRGAARLLALEAIARTEAGKADEAAASLRAALRVGNAVRREPVLISTLVRVACDAIAIEQVSRWASRSRPSPEALRTLEDAVAADRGERILEMAMVGERCFGMDIYRRYVLEGNNRELLGALGGGPGPGTAVLKLIPKAYFKDDMICYIDIMNDYVAASRKPYPERFMAGVRAGAEVEKRIPRWHFISRMIVPALGRVFTVAQQHAARHDSARVGLAALRYRAKHGRLPAALADLAPDFVTAVPLDPFDGKPLRYRRTAGGFIVYAVGENGKDDGGRVEIRDRQKGDVGFRVLWPKAEF